MIGQDYFDLRSQFGKSLLSLNGLVSDAASDPDHAIIIQNLINSLKDPFVFVVVGEVNVGKSTFLNALFGSDITRTGIMPTTDKIYFFKHGLTERRVAITKTLEEVYVPSEFLKDFHIVDTPGTNSIEGDHQEITERFVPMADLVIFVFSAMNPWGASAWQFLDKVHRHWMRNVIFVLQQSDLRMPGELDAIVEYMKQLCRQRFGREFPIYAVSAKKAYLARSSGLDRERLLAESGFNHLETHISRSLGGSATRVSKLSNALRIAWDVLSSIQNQAEARKSNREEKGRVMRHIEQQLDTHDARTLMKITPAIEMTGADLHQASEELITRLHAQLTPVAALSSVLKERREINGIEAQLQDQVRTPSFYRWDRAAAIIEDDIIRFAEYLGDVVTQGLKVQIRDELRPDESFWKAQRRRFTQRMDQMLHQIVSDLKLEADLKPLLLKTRRLAAAQWFLVLPILLSGCYFAGRGAWNSFIEVEAVGGILGSALWIASSMMLKRGRLNILQKLAGALPDIRSHLSAQLRDDVHNLYESFRRVLDPTRIKLVEQERRQTSFNEQISTLVKSFQALDARLKSMAAAGDT